MKATGREIAVWFMAHAIWWAAGVFIVYPFLVTPLYRTLFTSGTSPAERMFYTTIVGFVVATIGWCVALLIFLSCRGNSPNVTPEPER